MYVRDGFNQSTLYKTFKEQKIKENIMSISNQIESAHQRRVTVTSFKYSLLQQNVEKC